MTELLVVGALALVGGIVWLANRKPPARPRAAPPRPVAPRTVAARPLGAARPQVATAAPVQRPEPAPRPAPKVDDGPLRTASPGTFPQHVAGEVYRQDALRRLVGDLKAGARGKRFDALLIPEPENPHDPAAVRVEIAGEVVGYVARREAAEYVAELARLGLTGQTIVTRARLEARRGRKPGEGDLVEAYLDFTLPLTLRGGSLG